jgi:SAM-dependent methyltransferase
MGCSTTSFDHMRSARPLSLSAWLRFDAVERLLPQGVRRVLEIGAGLGSAGALLAERFEYVGLEPDPVSYQVAVDRVGRAGTVLTETAEEFESSEPFDLVCAFEVLEHCEDDHAALSGWLRHVRPGGYAMVSVPLGRDRFGPWDRKAGHYRRYDRADVIGVFESAGLESVEVVAYGFPLGSATAAVRDVVARTERRSATFEERTASSGRQLQPPDWAGGVTRVVSAPFRLLQRPFSGTSLGPGIVALGRVSAAGGRGY